MQYGKYDLKTRLFEKCKRRSTETKSRHSRHKLIITTEHDYYRVMENVLLILVCFAAPYYFTCLISLVIAKEKKKKIYKYMH